MTVNEAITKAADIIGDSADRQRMKAWIEDIEETVLSETLRCHEGAEDNGKTAPGADDGDRELFVPDPYSKLYVLYIIMQNDLYLRDSEQYMNSASVFASAYAAFCDKYNREHMPLSVSAVKLL